MIETSSEFVTTAHPDRLADLMAAQIIQDIQAKDGPVSHAAIEVFLTHKEIIFAGEATTSLKLDDKYLNKVAVDCYNRAGYVHEMRRFWTAEQVVLPEDLTIVNRIESQSADIALGTTDRGEESGYNDQGIFFSSADNTTQSHLGAAHAIATMIGEKLFALSRESIQSCQDFVFGPDIKVVVTTSLAENQMNPVEITAITIAQSHSEVTDIDDVRRIVKAVAEKVCDDCKVKIAYNCKWVINGTGRFVIHGQVSDTSMTGRKISVNLPSAGPWYASKNCGGGSMIKCAHASDLILPLAARFIANVIVCSGLSSFAVVGCSGAIGQNELQSLSIYGDENFNKWYNERVRKFFLNKLDWSPISLANLFCFFESDFDFSEVVKNNFYGHPSCQPWESEKLILYWSGKLHDYLK